MHAEYQIFAIIFLRIFSAHGECKLYTLSLRMKVQLPSSHLISSHLISALTPLYLPAGNQARVADKSTVVSTSTRNFPNRLGKGAFVFLASAELASIAAIEGKLPSVDEYQKYASKIKETSADTFRYLNFHRLNEYVEKGKSADLGPEVSKLTSHISAPQQLIINNTIRHRVALSDI